MAMRYWTSSSSSWRTCSARMLRILVRVTSTPQAVASAGRPLTARSRADRSLEPSSCSRSAIGSKSRSATVCAMVGGWTGGPHEGHHRRASDDGPEPRTRRAGHRTTPAVPGAPEGHDGGSGRSRRSRPPTVPAVAVAVRTAAKRPRQSSSCTPMICMAPSAYCAARRTDERPLDKPPFDHRRELPRCSRSLRGSGRCCGGPWRRRRSNRVAPVKLPMASRSLPTADAAPRGWGGLLARCVRSWTRRRAAPAGEASGDAGCVEGQACSPKRRRRKRTPRALRRPRTVARRADRLVTAASPALRGAHRAASFRRRARRRAARLAVLAPNP